MSKWQWFEAEARIYTFISFRRWVRTVPEFDLLAFQRALAICHSEYINIKKFTLTKNALRSYEHDTYTYVTYTATLHSAVVYQHCPASGICPSTSCTAPVTSRFIHLHTPNWCNAFIYRCSPWPPFCSHALLHRTTHPPRWIILATATTSFTCRYNVTAIL